MFDLKPALDQTLARRQARRRIKAEFLKRMDARLLEQRLARIATERMKSPRA